MNDEFKGAVFCQYSPRYFSEAKGGDFDTSHDLSAVFPDGRRWKLGRFQHASWAGHLQYCANQVPKMSDRLAEAELIIEELCKEFRDHDLPYGSKAYNEATTWLATKSKSCSGS